MSEITAQDYLDEVEECRFSASHPAVPVGPHELETLARLLAHAATLQALVTSLSETKQRALDHGVELERQLAIAQRERDETRSVLLEALDSDNLPVSTAMLAGMVVLDLNSEHERAEAADRQVATLTRQLAEAQAENARLVELIGFLRTEASIGINHSTEPYRLRCVANLIRCNESATPKAGEGVHYRPIQLLIDETTKPIHVELERERERTDAAERELTETQALYHAQAEDLRDAEDGILAAERQIAAFKAAALDFRRFLGWQVEYTCQAEAFEAMLAALAAPAAPRFALFQTGDFALHSGQPSRWLIDCEALSGTDLSTLAVMLVERLPPFGSVEGVPRGGLRLAEHLRQHATEGPLLLVDDVLTTGASMVEQRKGRDAVGAVIFARGNCPEWITPLFQLTSAPRLDPPEPHAMDWQAEVFNQRGNTEWTETPEELEVRRVRMAQKIEMIRAANALPVRPHLAPAGPTLVCPECSGLGRIHSHNDYCHTCGGRKVISAGPTEETP